MDAFDETGSDVSIWRQCNRDDTGNCTLAGSQIHDERIPHSTGAEENIAVHAITKRPLMTIKNDGSSGSALANCEHVVGREEIKGFPAVIFPFKSR